MNLVYSMISLTHFVPMLQNTGKRRNKWGYRHEIGCMYQQIHQGNAIFMFKVNKKYCRATPAGIYLLNVYNRNTRTMYEICSKLRAPLAGFWCHYC